MKIVSNSEHFDLLITNGLLKAKSRIWIATANVKDLHIPGPGRRSTPLLDHLNRLQKKGVLVRILHGGKPGRLFLNTLNSNIELHNGDGFEMQHCPRVHSKIIIVDNSLAYTGSANLTGAGLGAKSKTRRNFESGVLFDDRESLQVLEEYFDRIWMGDHCRGCGRRKLCPSPFV